MVLPTQLHRMGNTVNQLFCKAIIPDTTKPEDKHPLTIENGKWVAEVRVSNHSFPHFEGSYHDGESVVEEWGIKHDERNTLMLGNVRPMQHYTHYQPLGCERGMQRFEATILFVADHPFNVLVYAEFGETDIYSHVYHDFHLIRARQVHKGELGRKAPPPFLFETTENTKMSDEESIRQIKVSDLVKWMEISPENVIKLFGEEPWIEANPGLTKFIKWNNGDYEVFPL